MKINNNILNFYTISNNYIQYISQYDKHIAYNKNNQRPYIGVILNINNFLYFAPLFSPKPQHRKYKDNLSFMKLFGDKNKTDYLGLIRFADMLPVPVSELSLLNRKTKDEKYNMLLNKQYKYINTLENRNLISSKATKIYNIVTSNNKNRTATFYKKLCCNFKVLEFNCEKYTNLA